MRNARKMSLLGILVLSLLVFILVPRPAIMNWQTEAERMGEIFYLIEQNYLYDIDLTKCRYEILKKLSPQPEAENGSGCLDKYSAFHNPEEFKIEVAREEIKINSVEHKTLGDTGYIQVKIFGEKIANDFEDALKFLRGKNIRNAAAFLEIPSLASDVPLSGTPVGSLGIINKVVIDLRNNLGGKLNPALKILYLFGKTKNDIMLTERRKHGEEVETIGSFAIKILLAEGLLKPFGEFNDFKIVILINGSSASASEIVAGTLQDWGFKVVGETSFKKGVGQAVFRLEDNSFLRITNFEFLTGNGKHRVNEVGVKPDIEVKWQKRAGQSDKNFIREYNEFFGDPVKDPQLNKALKSF